jgi:3-oxoacyl-[acyl-carrier-protein] synthase II
MRLSFLPGGAQGRAVAITGLGVVSTAGIGKDAFFAGLCRPGPVGTRLVVDFDPTRWFGPKEVRRVDRFAQMGVAAAEMALADGRDPVVDPARAGVIIGTGVGGLATLEEQILVHAEKGARRVSPFLVPMMMSNAAAGTMSIRKGWQGPCETTVTACAAGTHSIANAARLIATGRCDMVLAGGAEAACTPVALAGFGNMTALSNSGISRPFDAERDGFVMAEAAGVVLLEELEGALARGAHVYAILAGAASTADAHHITAPSPGGSGAAACMEMALEDAGIQPSHVRHINAHGTSTPLNDAAEAEAVNKVFGMPGPAITSTKGVTGHALGAAGAIEAVALALTIDRGMIPPTSGVEHPDPDIHLDLVVGDPRPWEPGPALSNSFGFGGHNGTLVMAPVS